MIVTVRMRMCLAFARCDFRRVGGRNDELAGFDTLGRDQAVGNLADFPDSSSQKYHFQASGMIEMHVRGRDDFIEVIVLDLGQAVADQGRMMIIDHRHDPHGRFVVAGDRFGDQG